jgi:hypothetical protein
VATEIKEQAALMTRRNSLCILCALLATIAALTAGCGAAGVRDRYTGDATQQNKSTAPTY